MMDTSNLALQILVDSSGSLEYVKNAESDLFEHYFAQDPTY